MRETADTEDSVPKAADTGGQAYLNEDWLRFETLLSDLSARFVNIPAS